MTTDGQVAVTRSGVGPGAGPPLVVLHGGGPGCHAEADFRALLPLLPRRDIMLVDLPGYGGTPLRRRPGPRFGGYADTLVAVLDALDVGECDVLAQSLGGIVGMVASARQPARIRRLVAFGSQPVPAPTGIEVDPALGSQIRAAYYSAGEPTPQRLLETVMAVEWLDPAGIPAQLLADRHAASVTEDGLAAAADPALLGAPDDLSALLARVAADTLLVWGEHDPFGEPAYGDWLASRLPRGSAVVVPAAAHHPQSERPQATAELIEAHLDRIR